jgi:predicted phage terminase large subunit-like protein
MSQLVKKTVEDWLRDVDYGDDPSYVPSEFALEFINFIKMVNGDRGEENASPVIHFKWLDNLCNRKQDSVALCARGFAKSSIFAEYFYLYLAVFGSIPGFGIVDYALYISDSIDNGVKKMRNRIERRYQNSEFLQEYITKSKITDQRWYFVNKFGKEFVVTGHGVSTGVRGTVELNTRPQLAILDDLISDEDARSQTVIDKVEDVVYSAIDNALHPSRRKIIWCGTPFNAKDPLYKAVESGAWYVSVFPVCQEFPCKKEEFRGGWEDRFPYEFVKTRYDKAVLTGKINSFNQELMLRIMSDEERLIEDGDLQWYKRRSVIKNKGAYNFYITTDFATSDKEHADFSVQNVWGLNSIGDWYWVDGVCKKMLMDESMNHLFRLAQKWQPQSVGVEITGQQGGFLSWIKQLMNDRNNFFNLACPIGSNKPGLRPTKDKMSRFQMNAVPLFKAGKVHFPEELRESNELMEILQELRLATIKGFKSAHDDQIDTVSMLGEMETWRPSGAEYEDEMAKPVGDGGVWGNRSLDDDSGENSYFV